MTHIKAYGVVSTKNKIKVVDKLGNLRRVSNDRVVGICGAPCVWRPRVIFSVEKGPQLTRVSDELVSRRKATLRISVCLS